MAAFSLLYLRVAPEVKEELEREARKAGRSLNEEAVGRLRRSLDGALAGRDQARDSETAVGERLSRGSVVGSRSVPGASTPAPRPASAPPKPAETAPELAARFDLPTAGDLVREAKPFSKADQAEGKRR